MRTALRKMGNSSGVIIPKPMLMEVGAQTGDEIELSVEAGKIVLAPVKRKLREGWAEASKAIAASGEGLAWPEFGNEDDENWTW